MILAYYVFWRDDDYNLHYVHIATKHDLTICSGDELVEVVQQRCHDLKRPFKLPKGGSLTVLKADHA